MFPDKDEPGERLYLQLKEVLPNLTHHQLPPGCKDYAEYYRLRTEDGRLRTVPSPQSSVPSPQSSVPSPT